MKNNGVQLASMHTAVALLYLDILLTLLTRWGEVRWGEARRGEARRGEARRGEARRGEARRGEVKWRLRMGGTWFSSELRCSFAFRPCQNWIAGLNKGDPKKLPFLWDIPRISLEINRCLFTPLGIPSGSLRLIWHSDLGSKAPFHSKQICRTRDPWLLRSQSMVPNLWLLLLVLLVEWILLRN